jgi:hypothetical protein
LFARIPQRRDGTPCPVVDTLTPDDRRAFLLRERAIPPAAALGSLADMERSRYGQRLGEGAVAWLAERCLPVRMYDAEAVKLNLPTQLEVPQLIGAAHKFLDHCDRFQKGEKHPRKEKRRAAKPHCTRRSAGRRAEPLSQSVSERQP